MFEGCPDREWKDGEKRTSRLVFIGRDLDMEDLREGFEECRAEESLAQDTSVSEPQPAAA